MDKITTNAQRVAEWIKTGVKRSPILLIYGLHMTCPEFRPFSILFIVVIGLFWNRPPPAPKTPILRELCAHIWAQRTTQPLRMVVTGGLGLLAVGFLVYCVLPWWVTLAVAGVLVTSERRQLDVTPNTDSPPSLRDTANEQEIAEFMPEITEVSRVLLQEVGEQGVVTTGPPVDGDATAGRSKNTAEEDEELYLSTLIPDVTAGNDFESAEHSGSSSDELYCPEGPELRKLMPARTPGPDRTPQRPYGAGEKPIEFKSSHFNANSSSDSDDNISRGLYFTDELDEVRRRPTAAPRPDTDPVSATSRLAANVLVDTVYKRLLDVGTLPAVQANVALQPLGGFDQRNPILATISSTINAIREASGGQPPEGESTDGDEDSDFEMLNSEELNNL